MRTTGGLALVWLKSTFDLHCQIREIEEAMCGIDDHTVLSHEVQPYNRSRPILHFDKVFCKDVNSNVKFKCGCC